MTSVYRFGRTFGVLTEASPLFMERDQIFSTRYTKEQRFDSFAAIFWIPHTLSKTWPYHIFAKHDILAEQVRYGQVTKPFPRIVVK